MQSTWADAPSFLAPEAYQKSSDWVASAAAAGAGDAPLVTNTNILGRAVRHPLPPSRRIPPNLEKELELANLSDACEELRCRMVKYEHATGRADAVGALFRRPVAQGYTEFLFKTSTRLFEYLGDAEMAREAAERKLEGVKETADSALELVMELRAELKSVKEVAPCTCLLTSLDALYMSLDVS